MWAREGGFFVGDRGRLGEEDSVGVSGVYRGKDGRTVEGIEGGFVLGRREGAICEVRGNCGEETGLECVPDIAGS